MSDKYEIIEALTEVKNALEWMWKNAYPENDDKKSDFFNLPASALIKIDKVLSEISPTRN